MAGTTTVVAQPFSTVIDVPPDTAPNRIGTNTRLNLFEGGAIGADFNAGSPQGNSVNVHVNIEGGSVGHGFNANGGSRVTIAGGDIGNDFSITFAAVEITGGVIGESLVANRGARVHLSGGMIGNRFQAFEGSTVAITGRQFLLNGAEVNGLQLGNRFLLEQRNVTLSGLLADGTPFSFDLQSANNFIQDHFDRNSRLTLCLIDDLVTGCAPPDAVVWDTAQGGNGHTYQMILSSPATTWEAARAAAESMTFRGVRGHLATLTSREEDLFIFTSFADEVRPSVPGLVSGDKVWIGLSDHEVEADYRWVTGEPFTYANWHEGEPNNFGGNEDFVHLQTKRPFGTIVYGWNDEDSSPAVIGYLVEFDAVPEPTLVIWWLPAMSVLTCGLRQHTLGRPAQTKARMVAISSYRQSC